MVSKEILDAPPEDLRAPKVYNHCSIVSVSWKKVRWIKRKVLQDIYPESRYYGVSTDKIEIMNATLALTKVAHPCSKV